MFRMTILALRDLYITDCGIETQWMNRRTGVAAKELHSASVFVVYLLRRGGGGHT